MIEIFKVFVTPIITIVEKLAPVLHEKIFGSAIKYGDEIRLSHVTTNYALHSHEYKFDHEGSSQQQQVTSFKDYDSNDFWLIKPQHGRHLETKIGEPVRHGDIVRLEHLGTKRNLHSHPDMPSAFSRQQEVTAFGNNGEGDQNDNWRVEVEGKGIWYEKKRIRLIHLNTKHALHSHFRPKFANGKEK